MNTIAQLIRAGGKRFLKNFLKTRVADANHRFLGGFSIQFSSVQCFFILNHY